METNHDILELIKATACKYLHNDEVMLFGSHARKEAISDGDFDVLIVTSSDLTPQAKTATQDKYQKDLLKEGIDQTSLSKAKKRSSKRKLHGHIIKNILNEANPPMTGDKAEYIKIGYSEQMKILR
ncbi:MAG: nucleotidyltransferase domain-containing protein [Bacteroidales bacterium]|nr:nucleotidyltransferase domain-containing protein [Bacteroidales bacterium]